MPMVSVWVCAHLDSHCNDELLIGIDYIPVTSELQLVSSFVFIE